MDEMLWPLSEFKRGKEERIFPYLCPNVTRLYLWSFYSILFHDSIGYYSLLGEREMELRTLGLQGRSGTTELHPRPLHRVLKLGGYLS